MKPVVVTLVLLVSFLAMLANSSPLPSSEPAVNSKETDISSRQAAQAPVAPAPADDDDDDDDDEDGLDLSVEDDDDEDDDGDDTASDDDDDDDDDSDYIERLIDDIFGGEDDDDDDDETNAVVEPIQAASPVQAPHQPVIPPAVQQDFLQSSATDTLATADGGQAVSDAVEAATGEGADDVPEGQAATNFESNQSPVNPGVHQTVNNNPIAQNENDDDDDDDDDDEEGLSLADPTADDDDDDEDDDDEDDDDDDDDDDDEARQARALENETPGSVSAIYVAKYNRFIDSILARINNMLETKYNPVSVKLASPKLTTKSTKNKSKSKKKKIKKTSTKKTGRDEETNDVNTTTTVRSVELSTIEPLTSSNATEVEQTSSRSTIKNIKRKNSTKNTKKPGSSTKPSTKNKTKQNKPKPKSRARATLYGLPTLKRSGNVSVNMMSDHTTVRTKFSLGPLILKVEKEFGRAAKKELRSATATTAEMSGKLSLRVLHGGAATLHSIRVLQPKQVRVDSVDDHDRTREFVWRRSSHIAHLVSQKLSSATRSMLRPPPFVSSS